MTMFENNNLEFWRLFVFLWWPVHHPCFRRVLLTNTPHNILSRPLVASPYKKVDSSEGVINPVAMTYINPRKELANLGNGPAVSRLPSFFFNLPCSMLLLPLLLPWWCLLSLTITLLFDWMRWLLTYLLVLIQDELRIIYDCLKSMHIFIRRASVAIFAFTFMTTLFTSAATANRTLDLVALIYSMVYIYIYIYIFFFFLRRRRLSFFKNIFYSCFHDYCRTHVWKDC